VNPWVRAEEEVPLELGALYQAYAPRVASWAARLAGPGIDAEDLVHDVFLTVHRELPRFRGASKVSTWLYGITANIVRDRRRREKRRWLRHFIFGKREQLHPPTPVEDLERRQANELCYRVLDGLDDKHRTVLILFELEGHSGEEIAELTGTRVETVWVQLHRARARFKARLEAMGGAK
jgi:RNA polymerase sigma-70 factor (ECF subfamily)